MLIELSVPYGRCQCGCGQKTKISDKNDKKRGHTKGVHRDYLQGHYGKSLAARGPGPNPSGLCMCGCGEETPLAPQSRKSMGWVTGKPIQYINGHTRCGFAGDEYEEQDRNHKTPCWVWQRSVNRDGYGQCQNGLAHRAYYREYVGEIPVGLELDHLCYVPACVNPDHLEPVTAAENKRRAVVRRRMERDAATKAFAHVAAEVNK